MTPNAHLLQIPTKMDYVGPGTSASHVHEYTYQVA